MWALIPSPSRASSLKWAYNPFPPHPLGHLDNIQYIRYEQGLRRKRENKNGLKTAKVQNLDAFDRGVFW